MRYEIENRKGNLILYFYTDITEEEYEKLKKINRDIILHVGKDFGFTPTVDGTCIKFSKEGFRHVVTENDIDTMKKDVESFFEWLRNYQIPEPEPECPSHDEESKAVEDLEFVKKMLHDINLPDDNLRHICGALIVDTTTSMFCPEITGWGKLSYRLLKEMCELYVKTYGES